MDISSNQSAVLRQKKSSSRPQLKVGRILSYTLLIALSLLMLLPFAWMLSSSLKLDKDVFRFPIQWIPATPVWSNYLTIWTQIPFLTYFANTFKLTVVI